MSARRVARLGLGLLLLAALGVGLWQCSEEATTDSRPAGMQLELRRGSASLAIDSVEVEVWRGSSRVAADTFAVDSSGAFAWLLPLDAGGSYTVRAYARGVGPDAWPGASPERGVVASAAEPSIEVRAGRLVTAILDLASAGPAIDRVSGEPGQDTIRVFWSRVGQASAYELAWYRRRDGLVHAAAATPDTQLALAWDRVSARRRPEAESDSVLFRARAIFGTREGVYGPGLWRELASWLDLPRLTGVTPLPGTTIEPDAFIVHLAFDRSMALGTVEDGAIWELLPSGERVEYTVAAEDASHARLRLEPEAGTIHMDASYRLRLTAALTDADGRPFDADPFQTGLQDAIFTWTTAPYAPLQVVALDPPPGSSEVPLQPTLRVAFNRAVDPASVSAARIWVHSAAGLPVAGSLTIATTRDTVAWQASVPFWYAAVCTLGVSTDVCDAQGRALDQDAGTYPEREPFVAPWRVLEQPLGPRVDAIQPAAGETGVSRDAAIEVEFSEPVDTLSVRTADSFRVLRAGQVGIPGALRHDAEQRRFSFHPGERLQTGTVYQVQVNGQVTGRTGVTDRDGIPLDQDRGTSGFQSFLAAFRVERAPAVQSLAFEPARSDSFARVGAVVRLRFTRAIDPATLSGAAIGLRRGTATVPATLQVASDSLVVRITPGAPLIHERRYAVWVDTLVTTRDGSRLDTQPERPWHEPYLAFFTAEPESLHPRVARCAPAAGDTAVAVTDSIRIEFTSVIDPATVTVQTLQLARAAGGSPPVAASVRADTLTAWLVPSGALAYGTEYEVKVTTAVTSRNGFFALDQDRSAPGLQSFASRFTTIQERVAPYVAASQPIDGANEVPVDSPIRLTFSESMDASSIPPAFSVLQADVSLGGVLTSNQGLTVWTFTPDEPLAWHTPVAVRLETTARDLAGNRLDQDPETPDRQPFEIAFVTQTEGTPPRVTANSPADGAAGVRIGSEVRLTFSEPLSPATVAAVSVRIRAGEAPVPGALTLTGADSIVTWFPIDPVDSTRVPLAFATAYRVDADTLITDRYANRLDQDPNLPGAQPFVAFFTTQPETLAPRVTALLPGTADVPVDARPQVIFSEPMDGASLTRPDAVRLLEGATPVAIALELAASADTLTLAPAQTLRPSQYYTLRVDTLATDRVGNALDQDADHPGPQPYLGVFLTEADTTAPRVLGVSPADAEQHADPGTGIEAIFSERIDPGTVHGTSVYLNGPDGVVALRDGPSLDETGTRVRLLPAGPLAEGEAYGLLVSHLVTDLVGHALDQEPETPGAQDFTSAFRIGLRPVVVWAGGLCALGDSTRVRFDAGGSYAPDEGATLRFAYWDWGDGTRDTLGAPGGLMATHAYDCQDRAGCDALDNDGDGAVDEGDAGGCDESHRVILRLADTHGVTGADTAGVAFCAFQVLEARPASGDSVGMTDTVRFTFSRGLVRDGLEEGIEFVQLRNPEPVVFEIALRDAGHTLQLQPAYGFGTGEYHVRLTEGVRDSLGVGLDQDACLPGHQAFEWTGYGPPRPPLPPPVGDREAGPPDR
jgi:hypothetical protein